MKPNGALCEFPPKLFPALQHDHGLKTTCTSSARKSSYINFLNSAIVAVLDCRDRGLRARRRWHSASRASASRAERRSSRSSSGTMGSSPARRSSSRSISSPRSSSSRTKLLGLVPFYVAWVIPFSTFMIKGYIESIPWELDEAVYMDGGSVFTVFFKVICPLASPGHRVRQHFQLPDGVGGIPWA
ncbi:MAG: hypothetical protein ACLU3I_08175 [Acutalibacteraceae bacterium]